MFEGTIFTGHSSSPGSAEGREVTVNTWNCCSLKPPLKNEMNISAAIKLRQRLQFLFQLPATVEAINLNKYVWHEICALLGYCAAYSGNSVPTVRDNLSAPSSRVKKSKTDRQVFPKRRYGITTLRCVITQKCAHLTSTLRRKREITRDISSWSEIDQRGVLLTIYI
jgi:hypothetical protein